MIRYVPFVREHLDMIGKRPGVIFNDLGELYEKHSALSVLLDDKIIFCGGIIYLWPNTGDAWLLTSPGISEHRDDLIRVVQTFIDTTIKELNLDRVQSTIQSDFKDGVILMNILGWKREGLLRKYAQGKDFYLYSWVREN